jgi:hypothetical protein
VARAPQREQKFNAGILNVALTADARGPLERHACVGIFLQGVAAVRGFLAGVVRNKLGKTRRACRITWTKTFLQSKGVLEKAERRGAHRRKRPRRPMPGMMLHQDGSPHEWLKGRPPLDLIVTLDDATSTIYSAFLVEEEGTASTFRGLREVFGKHGLPRASTRTGALP